MIVLIEELLCDESPGIHPGDKPRPYSLMLYNNAASFQNQLAQKNIFLFVYLKHRIYMKNEQFIEFEKEFICGKVSMEVDFYDITEEQLSYILLKYC